MGSVICDYIRYFTSAVGVEFDNVSMPKSADGLYRNCSCGYIVSQANKGFLGTTPVQVFMIYFDDDGLAYKCAYETGGKGG